MKMPLPIFTPASSCPSHLRIPPIPIRAHPRASAAISFLALLCLALPACAPRNYLNDNDRLRAENFDLTEKVQKLSTDLASTRKALEIEQHRTTPQLPPGITRPVTASVEIGSFSGGIDTDNDRRDDALRLYVKTYDAQNNFLPTIGSAKLTAAYVPAGKPAVTVATAEISAKDFQAAYRSGVAGTHYTFTIPITAAVPADVKELIVSVAVTDLLTGGKIEAQKSLRWSTATVK